MATAATQQGVMTDEGRIRELLLLNLFAVFSERDRERRMEAIVANYTEDVVWSAPEGTTYGHEALNEGAQKLLDSTPAFVFTAAGPVHVLGDLGYLPFTYGVPEQPPASVGSDVALVRDGRIAILYTLTRCSTGSPTGSNQPHLSHALYASRPEALRPRCPRCG